MEYWLKLYIMAAGTHSPGGPNGIIRSQSFAGFSTLQERRSRCNSFMGNSAVQKKPISKPRKPHLSGHKSSSSSSREPQPKRVEEVYGALKQGLDEYLEVHQTELDKLTSLMKDMKRNSRLGVLYDLDKQIKTIERYMRRLEFHISKVDELYEGFCIQRRLRDGASKMKQAFTASPSTKGTRESLAEVNRRYKEYTECEKNLSNMFCISITNVSTPLHPVSGLAGFARLCPGDQYEIYMRYGRQRWKLKGKIETNSKQSWDGEEMIFMPLITDLINIKVTELKGLANHILVGSVICETKDLFTAMPQVVAVDVNDLGTIKLNLEVAWFPFDVEDLTLSSGNVSKATALQRRVSVYSQGTPETPTFQDTSFFSTLPDDVFENGSCGVAECKRLSFTFSDTPTSSPAPIQSNPEITVTPPETYPLSEPAPASEDQPVEEECVEEDCGSVSVSDPDLEWDQAEAQGHGTGSAALSLCSESQLSAVGPEDVVFLEPNVSDEALELKPVELDGEEGSLTRQLVRRLTSSDMLPEASAVSWSGESSRTFQESSLEEAIQSLLLRLESLGQRCGELQDLEQEVMRLEDLLKCRVPAHRSRSSSLSLTVESALESFDFLNTSDFDDDDTGDDAAALSRAVFFDMESERIRSGQHPEARGHLSEALTEDTGVGNSVAGSPLPLTTGNENLDVAIIVHLQYCSHLIQVNLFFHLYNFIFSSSDSKLLLGVVESCVLLPGLEERPALMSLWSDCSGGLFHTTLDRVLKHMHLSFALPLQQILSELASSLCPSLSPLAQDILTVFQFHRYAVEHDVTDMERHLLDLAKEVMLEEALSCGDTERCVKELQEVSVMCLQPRPQTLWAVAALLTSDDPDVMKAATAFLSSAASHKPFRSKVSLVQPMVAFLFFTEHVCVLLFPGEDGRLAYEQLDTVPREMVRLGTRRGNTVTTSF
uniref:Rho family-interacting cell polarization regulator 2 n=1 Tax=Cyprinus carpio carpio TaxID=630221 RepID=A0A9J8ABT3_CYPCA